MDNNTIIGLITILLIFAAVFVLVFLIIKYARKKTKRIDKSIKTNIGMCKVIGNKSKFEIRIDAKNLVFLVENGRITGFKTKNSPSFKEYTVRREHIR